MFSLMGNCVSCIKQRREPKREVTLAILGLDSAGKTTTTKALLGDTLETAPTIGFNKEEVTFKNYHMVIYDLGGGKKIRDIWKNYLSEVYGIIYVVDSSDRQRIGEVKENLKVLLEHKQVQEKPLLLLANKQDIENAMDEVDLYEKLNLESVVNTNRCPCIMETCSALKGTGRRMDVNIKHGMTWLCTMLDKLYDKLQLRVQEDMEIAAKLREEENAARKLRVKKAREERERKEEEERKRLGIEKEEEVEDEDDFIDGPWKRLDADEIRKKEEKYKREKQKEKERQRRLKELEEEEQTTQTKRNIGDDNDDMFRAPMSTRSLLSYGLSNGTALGSDRELNSHRSDRGLNSHKSDRGFNSHRSDRGLNSHRSDEEEEDSEGLIPSVPRSSRQKLPPLQTPLGTKFMDNNNAQKQRKTKKNKPKIEEGHDNRLFETSNYSHLSVSRIEVESKNGLNHSLDNDDEDYYTRRSNTSKNNYYGEEDNVNQLDSARKKKGKKKLQSGSYEDEEGFDTLRLSQHLDDDDDDDDDIVQDRLEDRPPVQKSGRVLMRKMEGAGYREEERSATPVKKLKKKKKNLFRKNNISPSDDEYELSDVQGTPKKELPWVKPSSPRKMLDDVANHSNKWGLAEDLGTVDEIGFSRRRRPNYGNEDDMIL